MLGIEVLARRMYVICGYGQPHGSDTARVAPKTTVAACRVACPVVNVSGKPSGHGSYTVKDFGRAPNTNTCIYA